MKKPTAPFPIKNCKLVDKYEWIVALVNGKKVLHAGPTDYPLTEAKARTGRLLHLKLRDHCRQLVGVDLAEESIDWLKVHYGCNNIIKGDIENVDEIFRDEKFDVVLAGDVIEHISNVGKFYVAVKKILARDGKLIITIPNAFSLKKVLGVMLFRQERNHPDHLYYFTPLSIHQAAYRFGYEVREISSFMGSSPARRENRVANILVGIVMKMLRNNHLADELAVVLEVTKGE